MSQSWRPKSSGTQGEKAAWAALEEGDFRKNIDNVPIKTKFHRSTFLVDALVLALQPWSKTTLPYIACECQGELHNHTWGGRPAVKQQAKDDAKRNSLICEGFRFAEATRREILTGWEESDRLKAKREHRKLGPSHNLPGHILLDRILRCYDNDYWFSSDFYLEAQAQRAGLMETVELAGWKLDNEFIVETETIA